MQPRRLLLIRHATAAEGPIDAERPLTGPGVRNAGAIGAWLQQAELTPDRVLVSPALRAAQTWEHAGAQLAEAPQPVPDPRIYDNTVEQVLAAIREAPDDARIVAVVGHNPSIGELSAILGDDGGSPEARQAVDRGFPAGGVAVFVVPGPFAAVEPGSATLTDFVVPGD
jgi:phosphohistidine phosphatase